jgi:DNA-binding SARP family transcriptional activator
MWRLDQYVEGIVVRDGARLALADFVRVDVADMVDQARAILHTPAASVGIHDGQGLASELVSPYSRAELLPGWHDDWVNNERERLRQLRVHALEAASRHLVRMGQFEWALEAALEAVRSEPLRETSHRAVIEVHLAEGNAAEAVDALRRYRALLRDELGLRPSDQLVSWLNAQLSFA